jgi:hypothetical protein
MSWNDANELVVASNGAVYFAPVGTTLPKQGDDPTAKLNAAFIGAGYITEDGVSFSAGSEVTDFMAWQSRQAIRRDRQTQEIQASFAIQQWNEENLPFAFGGGDVVEHTTGIFSYTFPESDDSLDERSLVIDAQDGDTNYRIVIPRGNVTEAVEASFRRTETAQLPITFKALEPATGGSSAYILTDSDGFHTGS